MSSDRNIQAIINQLLKIKNLAQNFLNKVDEVTVHPAYQKIFNDARRNGNGYSGPSFAQEMDELRHQLEKFDDV